MVTKYPCMPVALDTGPCFPLSGVSLCTSPEIDLVIRMGATVEVLFRCVIPYKSRKQVFSENAARQTRAKVRNKEKKAPGKRDLGRVAPGENARTRGAPVSTWASKRRRLRWGSFWKPCGRDSRLWKSCSSGV